MSSKLNNLTVSLIPFLIVLAGVFVLYATIGKGRDENKENTAYTRVIDCIISKNANSRSQADIERCYEVVEHNFDLKLTRYDKL